MGMVFAAVACTVSPRVSVETLLREMVDRDRMARYPELDYSCCQASSYDRRSVEKGKDGWFANLDRSMFIRTEQRDGRKEYVMMDAAGPGAIVRFWMTFSGPNCGKGTMRIYLDGAETPTVEGRAFDILSGDIVAEYPFAASVSELTPYENRGHDLYFPIPYARSCKVTYESSGINEDDYGARDEKASECVYYNIEYRTYPVGTQVETYTLQSREKYADVIREVKEELLRMKPASCVEAEQFPMDTVLSAGESCSFDIQGPGAIRELALALTAADMPQALRSTVLEIAFDGNRTVWSPVGDFYGIGYRPLKSRTWFTDCREDGLMSAYWIMPFRNSCQITFRNLGRESVTISRSKVAYTPWKWDDRSMYFGAVWHQYTGIVAGKDDDAMDLNYVTLKGKGLYVGDALTVFNQASAWWGEGDEKIYVDGEAFPSHFGTGTEDYYGYAWCRVEPFTGHPFVSQPCGEGNYFEGYTVNSRFRVLDAIPFHSSLVFDMELWHWLRSPINYAPVSFWYMLPGTEFFPADGDTEGAAEPVVLHCDNPVKK